MGEDLRSVVGRNVRKRRDETVLSQEDFGQQLGFHRTYIGAIERGERNLSLKSLQKLADALGIDPLELLRG